MNPQLAAPESPLLLLLPFLPLPLCPSPSPPQATHHHGHVYIATTEFFGDRDSRTPSIYWAVVDPSHGLCKPALKNWGMVASADGLTLAYPVIAACERGVFLAYAYSGSGNLNLKAQSYPAYAGEFSYFTLNDVGSCLNPR